MMDQFPSGCPFALLEEVKNYPRVLLLSGSLIYQQPLLDICASRRISFKMTGRCRKRGQEVGRRCMEHEERTSVLAVLFGTFQRDADLDSPFRSIVLTAGLWF